ncbi:hypothetical protein [African swine fever virus]
MFDISSILIRGGS